MNILVAEDTAVNAVLLENMLGRAIDTAPGNPSDSPVLLRQLKALSSGLGRRGFAPA